MTHKRIPWKLSQPSVLIVPPLQPIHSYLFKIGKFYRAVGFFIEKGYRPLVYVPKQTDRDLYIDFFRFCIPELQPYANPLLYVREEDEPKLPADWLRHMIVETLDPEHTEETIGPQRMMPRFPVFGLGLATLMPSMDCISVMYEFGINGLDWRYFESSDLDE